MKLSPLLLIICSFLLSEITEISLMSNDVLAEEKKTRKTPALRERVYSQLARAQKLADEGQMNAYKHDGFWECMDTLRDKTNLENLWESGEAPWKSW